MLKWLSEKVRESMPIEGVKHINVAFSQDEYEKLLKRKKEEKKDWHDFFMDLVK